MIVILKKSTFEARTSVEILTMCELPGRIELHSRRGFLLFFKKKLLVIESKHRTNYFRTKSAAEASCRRHGIQEYLDGKLRNRRSGK